MKKIEIEIKEVAWSGNKVTKYQAVAAAIDASGSTERRIFSIPMATREGAMESLTKESYEWMETAKAAIDKIGKTRIS